MEKKVKEEEIKNQMMQIDILDQIISKCFHLKNKKAHYSYSGPTPEARHDRFRQAGRGQNHWPARDEHRAPWISCP